MSFSKTKRGSTGMQDDYLLLQEADGHGRYEVEIQLGASDESHIIRTIEYWDIERKGILNMTIQP